MNRVPYDGTNPTQREWSSRVYQAAKDFVPRFLLDNGRQGTFEQIKLAFKNRHPDLCNNSIGDPSNQASPYWGHLVATAMQVLKKRGAIQKGNVRGGWTLGGQGRQVISPAPIPRTSVPSPMPRETGTPLPEIAKPSANEEKQPIEEQLPTRILALNPSQFEKLLGEFLKAKGFSEVRVTGRAGDGGIDGECNLPFIKVKVAFQAKRYAPDNPISSPAIRNFKGGVVGRFDRGIFITTSSFTPGAIEEAEQPGVTIVLIDGAELVRQMIDLGLGVKTIPVGERQTDEGFFDSLG